MMERERERERDKKPYTKLFNIYTRKTITKGRLTFSGFFSSFINNKSRSINAVLNFFFCFINSGLKFAS